MELGTAPAKVTLHMVASLDFFIARKDNSVSWLESPDHYEKGAAFENAEEFVKTIGCFVMGSKTYEHAVELGWPYGDVATVVLTRRSLPKNKDSVEFYSGDLRELVNDRLKPRYKSIWLVGGALLAREFLRAKLVDDVRITIAPILLGGGTPFVEHVGEQPLRLKDATAYQNGMVELWYEVKS
jgi:dihydrofolate reductase